jgi:hypothetical protein
LDRAPDRSEKGNFKRRARRSASWRFGIGERSRLATQTLSSAQRVEVGPVGLAQEGKVRYACPQDIEETDSTFEIRMVALLAMATGLSRLRNWMSGLRRL